MAQGPESAMPRSFQNRPKGAWTSSAAGDDGGEFGGMGGEAAEKLGRARSRGA